MDFPPRFFAEISNDFARFWLTLNVGAAPHLPAGILSPYRDGERGALIAFANHRRCRKNAEVAGSSLLPVSIRGEGAGRRMRGGASVAIIRWTAAPSAEGHS
ncbi:hypothetical protein MesoLj113b_11590 [Mesorhizobium sp. 113-3-3]|nr:hypothetical protein MesoLj113b_11590 [Mesorhizobium sp. 113-3-3]